MEMVPAYHYYEAYGLCVASEILLPEFLLTSRREAEVTIRRGSIDLAKYEFGPDEWMHCTSERQTCFYWREVGSFLINEGREVIVDQLPASDDSLVRLSLTGIALSMLLHQRRLLVLHASAVVMNGNVVAFMGNKGQGKTTLAAALCARGHALVADDMLAVSFEGTKTPSVFPGYPQFRIWTDSAATAFGDAPESLPYLYEGCEKRTRRVEQSFARSILPLRAIYTFTEGEELGVRTLPPRQALLQVIINSFGARYSKKLFRGGEARLNMMQCESVAKHVSVFRIERPRSLSLLSRLATIVEERHHTFDVTGSSDPSDRLLMPLLETHPA